jgi:hypothetical protein
MAWMTDGVLDFMNHLLCSLVHEHLLGDIESINDRLPSVSSAVAIGAKFFQFSASSSRAPDTTR